MSDPKMRRVIEVAIASPSDVPEEREAVRDVFTRWNSGRVEAILHPVMWESASVPRDPRGRLRTSSAGILRANTSFH